MHPGLTEHAELIEHVGRQQAALEAATRDNAHLQRELAGARAENRRLHRQLDGVAVVRVREERRRMLSEPWSRNP